MRKRKNTKTARRSKPKSRTAKKVTTPSIKARLPEQIPSLLSIFHVDNLLESIRKRQVKTLPEEEPKWLSSLTPTDRKRLQKQYKQTYSDMKLACTGKDPDMNFAYAHYSINSLRLSCSFFSKLFKKDQKDEPDKNKLIKRRSKRIMKKVVK